MEKREFFDAVLESFFLKSSCSFDDFKNMVCGVMPVFGVLDVKREGDTIIFIDNDTAEMIIAPEGYKPTEEDMDMSCVIMKLTVTEDGTIETVSHGMQLFTPRNKEMALFLVSLIGKRIIF